MHFQRFHLCRSFIGESDSPDILKSTDQRPRFLGLILFEAFCRSGNHFIQSCVKFCLRELVSNWDVIAQVEVFLVFRSLCAWRYIRTLDFLYLSCFWTALNQCEGSWTQSFHDILSNKDCFQLQTQRGTARYESIQVNDQVQSPESNWL